MPRLLVVVRTDSSAVPEADEEEEEKKPAIGLECAGIAAQITAADWARWDWSLV